MRSGRWSRAQQANIRIGQSPGQLSSRPQPEVLAHRLEIAVRVDERVAVAEAEAGDQHVDRLAHRDAPAAERAVVLRGRRARRWHLSEPSRPASAPVAGTAMTGEAGACSRPPLPAVEDPQDPDLIPGDAVDGEIGRPGDHQLAQTAPGGPALVRERGRGSARGCAV
jgi:hypothetical protein